MTAIFDGPTFDPTIDGERLGEQSRKVFALMSDGRWRTLGEISRAVGAPEASASARLRDFRKARFGGHRVERRRRDGAGLYEYRMEVTRG